MKETSEDSIIPLHVCYFGTYRANFTRNQILISGLRTQDGVVVHECHATLWHSIEDRVEQATGGWRSPRFWWRVISTYWRLFRTHNRCPDYDVMLIGYPGQFDSYLARLLTWWRRKPLALDIHMSLYLVAEERGLTQDSPLSGGLIFLLEKGGLKLPDLLISENRAYEKYYCEKYHLSEEEFRRVPHGADERVYHPRQIQPVDSSFRVTYHGTFLPSHGMDAIIGSAVLLRHRPDIQFHFFGNGPERERIEKIAASQRLQNVTFHGFVDLDELLENLAQSHICLGVFGTTKQSNFTIQNKLWQGLAMGRAVVSGDSQVVRETLTHRRHIYLVERDNAQALAAAISELEDDPELREQIAQGGYERFLEGNSIKAIGAATEEALRSLV
jgi:glycosyltransferase involved in cell wall biosynthesis